MDIEHYIKTTLPTMRISNEMVATPLPPVRMKKTKAPQRVTDGKKKPSSRSPQRRRSNNSNKSKP
jgi:hypothetical protein